MARNVVKAGIEAVRRERKSRRPLLASGGPDAENMQTAEADGQSDQPDRTPANPPRPASESSSSQQGSPRLALRPKEAALALGIGERKLWEITADRTSGIPHVRFGKAIVYPVGELERWLAEQAGKRSAQ